MEEVFFPDQTKKSYSLCDANNARIKKEGAESKLSSDNDIHSSRCRTNSILPVSLFAPRICGP